MCSDWTALVGKKYGSSICKNNVLQTFKEIGWNVVPITQNAEICAFLPFSTQFLFLDILVNFVARYP